MFKWLLTTKHGFTLVELVIVLVLLGLGATAIINLFNITYKAFNKTEERYIKQEEVKRVAELLQNGTDISSALGVEIYNTLEIIPPEGPGMGIKGAAFLYTDPTDGFLYVRESDSDFAHVISEIPLYIYFEVVKKREINNLYYPDDDTTVPWKNQCGLNCSISAVENGVTNYTYPLSDDDIYYTISVSYHFPNMIERNNGRVNLSTDLAPLKSPIIDQDTGEETTTLVTSTDVGNVVKFYSETSLLSDAVTTDIQMTPWCFVATASYGAHSPDVGLLCEFRDSVLKKTEAGRWFVKKYYEYSPPIAEKISQNNALKMLTRIALKPLVIASYVILNPEWLVLAVPIAGAAATALVRRRQKEKFDE
ncbi:MAG: hypothetical protein BWY46_01003 [Firmicutes bacterium ADurb.Bin300]|nr:MAG: hypothetical protein BWY46_01003 [Firmicutes bacterium ADurb.Bin300]